jgi:hypothetical protein
MLRAVDYASIMLHIFPPSRQSLRYLTLNPFGELTVVCQGEFTKKFSNSSAEELFYQLNPPVYPAINPSSFPHRSGSLTPMDFNSEDLLTEENNDYRWTRWELSNPGPRTPLFAYLRATVDRRDAGDVTIDTLPDDVLLEIFAFHVGAGEIDTWLALVHVCRKWRIVVFGSPRRLNLRLRWGTDSRPIRARKTLDIWPPLPIVLSQSCRWGIGNVMAALGHNDRVCDINLWGPLSSSELEDVLAAMQQPFPGLTSLVLMPYNGRAQVIPNSFLGGSAPHLRILTLHDIGFPGLRKILSSATHLVELDLSGIPHSGYIFT